MQILLAALLSSAIVAGPEILAPDGLPVAGFQQGFFIHSADRNYTVHLTARLQLRYHVEAPVEDLGSPTAHAFSIPRARLKLAGRMFVRDFTYLMQVDCGRGFFSLKDFFLNYGIFPGVLHVQAGQFKRPFTRDVLFSGSTLDFMERSITEAMFGAGRGIGVMLHNDFLASPTFEWAAGLFNGTGAAPDFVGDVRVDPDSGEGEVVDGKFTNIPAQLEPRVVARVGYNYRNIDGYAQPDLVGGPLRFGVGASGQATFDQDDDDDSQIQMALDWIVKLYGFAATGEVYASTYQTGKTYKKQDFQALGAFAQASYVIAERVQPALRYAFVWRDDIDRVVHEAAGSVTVYIFANHLKWQADLAALLTEEGGALTQDLRFRTQVQLQF